MSKRSALILLVVFGIGFFAILGISLVIRSNYQEHEKTTHAVNLMQIGYGLEEYRKVYGSFPSGTIENQDLTPSKRLSWIVSILPFIEQDNLFQTVDRTKGWEARENASIINRGLFIFSGSYEEGSSNRCVGVAGVGVDAPELPISDPKAGVFGHDRKTRLADIKDGAANTMMVIDTRLDLGPWAAGGQASVRGIDTDHKPYIGLNRQFGGYFRNGTWVLMADGSIRWIKETIDPATFEALATIAGGEKVELAFDY
jgi:hypothetical protein